MSKTIAMQDRRAKEATREALVDLFVEDLRAKADATDDPHCVIWLALHASAAITGGLGPFDRREVRSTGAPWPTR